jgi:hypothetical protein
MRVVADLTQHSTSVGVLLLGVMGMVTFSAKSQKKACRREWGLLPGLDTGKVAGSVSRLRVHLKLTHVIPSDMACRLPLARLYVNYFGGQLDLMTLYGHGTDVFLKLRRLDKPSAAEI